jgi:hypothetical protein
MCGSLLRESEGFASCSYHALSLRAALKAWFDKTVLADAGATPRVRIGLGLSTYTHSATTASRSNFATAKVTPGVLENARPIPPRD